MVFSSWKLKKKAEELAAIRSFGRVAERLRCARRNNTGCASPPHIELLEQHHYEHSAPSSGKSGDYPTIRRIDYSTNPHPMQNAGKAEKVANYT
jgi:hypothetical protein